MIPKKLGYKKASSVLKAAASIIRNPKHWVTGYEAVREARPNESSWHTTTRTIAGEHVEVAMCNTKADCAIAFCAMGAVKRINGPAERSALAYLREAGLYVANQNAKATGRPIDKTKKPMNYHIFNINDGRQYGHKQVLKMFARAIRRAKADGK